MTCKDISPKKINKWATNTQKYPMSLVIKEIETTTCLHTYCDGHEKKVENNKCR